MVIVSCQLNLIKSRQNLQDLQDKKDFRAIRRKHDKREKNKTEFIPREIEKVAG